MDVRFSAGSPGASPSARLCLKPMILSLRWWGFLGLLMVGPTVLQ